MFLGKICIQKVKTNALVAYEMSKETHKATNLNLGKWRYSHLIVVQSKELLRKKPLQLSDK